MSIWRRTIDVSNTIERQGTPYKLFKYGTRFRAQYPRVTLDITRESITFVLSVGAC